MEPIIIEHPDNTKTIFYYLKDFIPSQNQKEIFSWVSSIEQFVPSENLDKDTTRLQRWYQQDNRYFCDKWKKRYDKWQSFNYNKQLNDLQNLIMEKLTKLNLEKYGITLPKINSCLINKYRNGNDYIKPHRDTHLSFGRYPTVINLSLGGTRKLFFRSKNNTARNYSFNLESGSLFVMAGSSQEKFTHEITKSKSHDIRYSFTFREMI